MPEFVPRTPWLGGDLQTLRNFLVRHFPDLTPWPGQRLTLPLDDGSGDALSAMLHRADPDFGNPLVILVHGLTGCEGSSYILQSARHLLSEGYPVLRLNLRGAGPSRPLCRQQYHAGRSDDLRMALTEFVRSEPGAAAQGLVLAGYSLGANMMLKFLAEGVDGLPVGAAAAVSAPIELQAAQQRIMMRRNCVYHRYLLERMKEEGIEN